MRPGCILKLYSHNNFKNVDGVNVFCCQLLYATTTQ